MYLPFLVIPCWAWPTVDKMLLNSADLPCTQLLREIYKRTAPYRRLLLSSCTSLSLSMKMNPLMPNDTYRGRTAPLTSKRCILYTYSTNISTEYFKHGIYFPFLSLKNAVYFIILTYLVPVLFTFYIQSVLKIKNNNSGAKRLNVFISSLSTLFL